MFNFLLCSYFCLWCRATAQLEYATSSAKLSNEEAISLLVSITHSHKHTHTQHTQTHTRKHSQTHTPLSYCLAAPHKNLAGRDEGSFCFPFLSIYTITHIMHTWFFKLQKNCAVPSLLLHFYVVNHHVKGWRGHKRGTAEVTPSEVVFCQVCLQTYFKHKNTNKHYTQTHLLRDKRYILN